MTSPSNLDSKDPCAQTPTGSPVTVSYDPSNTSGPTTNMAWLHQPVPSRLGVLTLGAGCGIGGACPRGFPAPHNWLRGVDDNLAGA
jgi:hypothetical protein